MRRFATDDRLAITELLDTQREAWNRGDIEAFMEGYANTPDLVFTSGAQIRRGWQATLERYQARYGDESVGMGRLHFEVLHVQHMGADGAVVLGRWRLSELGEHDAEGVFTVIFERRAEGWRIVHDHTSVTPSE